MKKLLLGVAIALLSCLSIYSQSSELITNIIKAERATCEQISYLPALYANKISEEDTEAKAFEILQNDGLFSSDFSASTEVTLDQACYVYAKALGVKGGLFYTLFPSPRYAFKEFKAQGLLPAQADPDMHLSGRDSLDLFNSCLEATGGNE